MRFWDHPILCHRPAACCPSSLSLYPTRTIINLSLRFELLHLPPSSTSRAMVVIAVTCPCWPKEESQRRAARAEPDPGWLPGIGAVAGGCACQLVPGVASACPDVPSSRSTRFLKHPLLCGTRLSPGVATAFPQRGTRPSRACTKQMVKHGLTRSEINLHFASKSHNHVIIPSIGEEQAPGSCFLLGRFARQDGVRAGILPCCCCRAPVTAVGLPSVLLVYALQCCNSSSVSSARCWERPRRVGAAAPHHTPHSHPALLRGWGLSTLCWGSPARNTSQSTFPQPWHGAGANPAQ